MKFSRSLTAILLSVVFLFSISTTAFCGWHLGDDDDLLLERIDTDIDAPYHEINEGTYGYYDEYDDFVVVLDFYDATPIQYPYNWSVVYWAPSSMDK